jgi:hypothetical protein
VSDPKLEAIKHLNPAILAEAASLRLSTMAPADSPATRPGFPAGPEPARVYGYLAFVDPATAEKWVPHTEVDRSGLSQLSGGLSQMAFRFVNQAGETYDLSLPSGGFRAVGRNPDGSVFYGSGVAAEGVCFAFYYDFQMNPDRSEGYPRMGAPASVVVNMPRVQAISYNPDQWRFLDIVEPISYANRDAGAATNQHTFTRRETPFPDLPDTA